MASPPAAEEQARLLEDALTVVRQQGAQMRRCLETPGKLMDALKCRYAHRLVKDSLHRLLLTPIPQFDLGVRASNQQPWT